MKNPRVLAITSTHSFIDVGNFTVDCSTTDRNVHAVGIASYILSVYC